VRELFLLVILPGFKIASWVKYLAMEELLGFDLGEIAVDLDLPLTKNIVFSEMLDKVADPVEPVVWLSDHIGPQSFHLAGILGEILGQRSFLAARRYEEDVLLSLREEQKGQLNFPRCQLDTVLH